MSNPITVLPVRTRRERHAFLTFPWRIYRGDPLWVPPLLPDWAERIDPARGAFYRRGEVELFIAWRGGQPVGTICAAEDRAVNAERGVKECVFGFFQFIEDYAVFEALLENVRGWAQARGLDTLTGPYNLDYEDSYGVLVEGRDRPPALLCGHTPPYYLPFYERCGFQPARGDNIAFALDLSEQNTALADLARMGERVRVRGRFRVRGADLADWDAELDRVHALVNIALAHLPDFRSWSRETVAATLAPFREIADPELILFVEENGQPVGWMPGLPDLNQALRHANGLRYAWNYLPLLVRLECMKPIPGSRFTRAFRRALRSLGGKVADCLTVKSVLVPPEYWGSGGVILLFDEMVRRARARGYRWIDGSLTSDDNPRTPALGARLGAKIYKRYRVYKLRIA